MIYGVTGTLNMAELAARLSARRRGQPRTSSTRAPPCWRVAFLIKAAAWPLNFWLVPAYAAATPPVAAIFALLTKVGVYALRAALDADVRRRAAGAGSARTACSRSGWSPRCSAALGMLASQRLAAGRLRA